MKKLFTTLALGSVCTGSVCAQKSLDLGITSTASATTLGPGETVDIGITLVNNGPDTLTASDTVVMNIEGTDQYLPAIVSSPLPAGGEVVFTVPLGYPDGGVPSDTEVEICFKLLPQSDILLDDGTPGGRPLTVTYGDTNGTNDLTCQTITVLAGGSASAPSLKSLENVRLSVYPNPADGNINFTYSFDKASDAAVARVLDLTGRVVMAYDFGKQAAGKQSFSMNVAFLPAGVYTLEFAAGENRGIGKFIRVK